MQVGRYAIPAALFFAAPPAYCVGPGGTLTVTAVSMDGPQAYIDAQGGLNPDGCTLPGRFALPNDPAQRDAFYAAAITALTTGMKMTVWVNGCASAPWGTVPNIYYFSVSK